MTYIIYSYTGKTIKFNLFVYDNGVLTDSLTDPIIKNIYKPDLNLVNNFPQEMDKIDNGIYSFSFTIPSHPSSIGNFIADVEYTHPNGNVLNNSYQVIVRRTDGLANGFIMVS